ncbi:MAG TPA: hypothetical protein VHY77_05930 [Acidimicrobiales bacterium]|nr:hypothetical protein [Acidimicrobiales bacterium]
MTVTAWLLAFATRSRMALNSVTRTGSFSGNGTPLAASSGGLLKVIGASDRHGEIEQ